jgi:hypothetical protein
MRIDFSQIAALTAWLVFGNFSQAQTTSPTAIDDGPQLSIVTMAPGTPGDALLKIKSDPLTCELAIRNISDLNYMADLDLESRDIIYAQYQTCVVATYNQNHPDDPPRLEFVVAVIGSTTVNGATQEHHRYFFKTLDTKDVQRIKAACVLAGGVVAKIVDTAFPEAGGNLEAVMNWSANAQCEDIGKAFKGQNVFMLDKAILGGEIAVMSHLLRTAGLHGIANEFDQLNQKLDDGAKKLNDIAKKGVRQVVVELNVPVTLPKNAGEVAKLIITAPIQPFHVVNRLSCKVKVKKCH